MVRQLWAVIISVTALNIYSTKTTDNIANLRIKQKILNFYLTHLRPLHSIGPDDFVLRGVGVIFIFLNFYRTFCKQTVETLIRYRVLLGLIWFCTVYLCPTKRTLGICGLIALYEKMPFSMSGKWRKAWCVIFFLEYFFSDNTRLFGIIWASLWEKLFSGVGGGVESVSTKSVSNQSPQLKRLAWKLKFHLQQVYIWYFPKSWEARDTDPYP